jgi:hypothetical protein
MQICNFSLLKGKSSEPTTGSRKLDGSFPAAGRRLHMQELNAGTATGELHCCLVSSISARRPPRVRELAMGGRGRQAPPPCGVLGSPPTTGRHCCFSPSPRSGRRCGSSSAWGVCKCECGWSVGDIARRRTCKILCMFGKSRFAYEKYNSLLKSV